MVNREELCTHLSVILPIVKEGIITVENGKGIVSHIDQANVAMVWTEFEIPFPDGVYGVDFKKLYAILNAYSTTEVDIKTTKNYITLRSGSLNNKVMLLNTDTLQAIRNKSVTPLPCIVEINSDELVEIVSFIDSIATATKNEVTSVYFSFDGLNLSVKCPSVEDTDKAFDMASVELGKGEKFNSCYSFLYLKDITKAINKSFGKSKIRISIGNNTPCRIIAGDVEYVLANIVEDE